MGLHGLLQGYHFLCIGFYNCYATISNKSPTGEKIVVVVGTSNKSRNEVM
jgi:hypothetical protein